MKSSMTVESSRAESTVRRRSPAVVFIVALLALALNQSGRVFGVNLSIADPLLIFTILVLLLDGPLRGARRVMAFFIVLSVSTIVTPLVITPAVFGTTPTANDILLDFIKIATSFLFLTVGYTIASRDLAIHVVRWFAIGATLVALSGIVLSILNIQIFNGVLYYNFARYRGLMVDPNYYAVLTCAAIAFFLRDRSTALIVRIFAIGVLGYSIMMSGSKTGTVALLALLALMIFDFALTRKYAALIVTGLAVAVGFVVAFWDRIAEFAYTMAQEYGTVLPQLYRISELFNDAVGAAAGGGSDRLNVWTRGIGLIETSPVVGVGIGSYRHVVEETSGVGTLAHNTYIQIAAEWGLPLAIIFVAWVCALMLRATFGRRSLSPEAPFLRDIILVFMIGSVSLSLNNARMFWFFLGILAFIVIRRSTAGAAPVFDDRPRSERRFL